MNKDLYRNQLIHDSIVNTIIRSLFESFEIMVVKKITGRQHGIQIVKLTVVDHEDFVIKLSAIDSDTVSTVIVFNKKVLNLPECKISLISYTSSDTEEYLVKSIRRIVDQYLNRYEKEHHSVVLKDKINDINNQLPIGFIKKIKEIKLNGTLFKYIVVFEDSTYHHVLSQNEMTESIKIGDYAHLDEHDQISFLPRTAVQ